MSFGEIRCGDIVVTDDAYRKMERMGLSGIGSFSVIGGKVVEIKPDVAIDKNCNEFETGKMMIRIQITPEIFEWLHEDRLARVGNPEEEKIIEAIKDIYSGDVRHLAESLDMNIRIGLRSRIMFFEQLFCFIIGRPDFRITSLLEENDMETVDYEGMWDPYPEFLNRSRIEEWAFRIMEDYREKSLSSRYPDKEYLGYVILVQEEILQILEVGKEEIKKIKTEVAKEYFEKELAASFR